MVLYVVRHGEIDFNTEKRYAGNTDIPLNKVGIDQAKQLAEKLNQSSFFDFIITSSLIRAKQTAEIINETRNIPLIIIDEFKERNLGVFEGLTHEEIKIKYPDLYERKCTRQMDDAPTNGETIREFDERITKALLKLKEEYSEKNVLLVTHGGVSMIINRYYKNLSFDEMYNGFRLGNCEIVKYIV